MAWTKYQLFLAAVMVITGSINTLSVKWADMIESKSRDGIVRQFHHAFFQASCMFFGELCCFAAFKILFAIYKRQGEGFEDENQLTRGNRDFNVFTLFIPAMCDFLATSTMYVGLNLTYASSFQMLRGAVIIFVALLSLVFLHRIIDCQKWIGIGSIIGGLVVVGLADFSSGDQSLKFYDIVIGDSLIVVAQIMAASQVVIEEKYIAGLDIAPLQAVGWEGIFGFIVSVILLIPFYFINVDPPFSNNPRNVLEDAIDASVQVGNNFRLVIALTCMIISIGFFNYAGISITKEMCATTRMVLDSVRTLVVWLVSLSFFGQTFKWLQLLGFAFLILGMCLYNNITCQSCRAKVMNCFRKSDGEEGAG